MSFLSACKALYAGSIPTPASTYISKHVRQRLLAFVINKFNVHTVTTRPAPGALRSEALWTLPTGHTKTLGGYATTRSRPDGRRATLAADIRGALPHVQQTHHAAITESKAVGAMLRAKTATGASQGTGGSLRLAPLVFVRLGELRRAEWRIPAPRKGRCASSTSCRRYHFRHGSITFVATLFQGMDRGLKDLFLTVRISSTKCRHPIEMARPTW